MITKPDLSAHALMRPPATTEVTWTDGFWADKWTTLCERMIPSQRRALHDPTNAAYFPNFEAAANLAATRTHFGVAWSDGDCYKYLEAITLIFAKTGDEDLRRELDDKIAQIAAAQDSDGYLSTNIQLADGTDRWSDTHNHELYNMGHLMTAATVHFSVTGQRSFLDVAIRNADYLHRTFAHRPPELAHYGWNPSNIMGLVDLYRVTDDERYLRLAEVFVETRGSAEGGTDQNQDHVSLRREHVAAGHAVTGPYLWAGAADIVAETGDEGLLDAIVRIWENATQRRMYVTGGIGTDHYGGTDRQDLVHESFGRDYDLPNSTAYNETCANIALAMWSGRLAALTGESRFTDVVERVMYNAGLSGVSVDGDTFCYTNPLRWYGEDHQLLSQDAQGRWETFYCYCCPVQVTRTLAHLHEWVYGVGGDALWIHLFAGSRIETSLDAGKVVIEQRTDYPWNGAVDITVHEAPAVDVAVHVRIPDWAAGATVSVNGTPVDDVAPGAYLEVLRTWSAGDVIALNLPLEPRVVVAHPRVEAARNQGALALGPVVYCLESVDLPADVDVFDMALPRHPDVAIHRGVDQLGGVSVLTTKLAHRQTQASGGKLYGTAENVTSAADVECQLIPYFAWNNRGTPEMTVWLPFV